MSDGPSAHSLKMLDTQRRNRRIDFHRQPQ